MIIPYFEVGPITNTSGAWLVLIHYNPLNVIQLKDPKGNVVDQMAATSLVSGVSLTAGSGTGTTDNQTGQVYSGSIPVGIQSRRILVPPNYQVTIIGSNFKGVIGVQCDTLEEVRGFL